MPPTAPSDRETQSLRALRIGWWLLVLASGLAAGLLLLAAYLYLQVGCRGPDTGWGRNRTSLCRGEVFQVTTTTLAVLTAALMTCAIVAGLIGGLKAVSDTTIGVRRAMSGWLIASSMVPTAAAGLMFVATGSMSHEPALRVLLAVLAAVSALAAWLAGSGLVVLIVRALVAKFAGDAGRRHPAPRRSPWPPPAPPTRR